MVKEPQKIVNFRLDESRAKALKAFCDKADITQADFINQAIEHELNEIVTEKSGGVVIRIPSPYIYQDMSDEAKAQIIELMNDTAYKFSKIAGGRLDLGLHALAGFVETRFNAVNEERDKANMREIFADFVKLLNDFNEVIE